MTTIASAADEPLAPRDAEHLAPGAAPAFDSPAVNTWHVLVDFDGWLCFDPPNRQVTLVRDELNGPRHSHVLMRLGTGAQSGGPEFVRQAFLAATPTLERAARRLA